AIGSTPALYPGHPFVGHLAAKLDEQPGLADAGFANNADDLTVTAFDLPQRAFQNRELAVAVDEGCRTCGWRCRHAERRAPKRNTQQPVGQNRLGLAFEG